MGIKLKWFRHRLTLEQPEIATDTPAPALMRTTSVTEFRENCARGVYRQAVDSESLILSEKPSNPATNGKTKTKTSKCSSGVSFIKSYQHHRGVVTRFNWCNARNDIRPYLLWLHWLYLSSINIDSIEQAIGKAFSTSPSSEASWVCHAAPAMKIGRYRRFRKRPLRFSLRTGNKMLRSTRRTRT